jgi:hypothetical protein
MKSDLSNAVSGIFVSFKQFLYFLFLNSMYVSTEIIDTVPKYQPYWVKVKSGFYSFI